MANKCCITISVSFKWWFKPYIKTLGLFCYVFGTEPDEVKLLNIIKKGTIFKLGK